MNSKKKILTDGHLAWIIVLAILVVDQLTKIWVKTHMTLGSSIEITNWFYIAFIENKGMAFGMTLGSKVVLSVIRIVAVSAIGWFIWQTVKQHGRTLYVVLLSMIAAALPVISSTPCSMDSFSATLHLTMSLISYLSVRAMLAF